MTWVGLDFVILGELGEVRDLVGFPILVATEFPSQEVGDLRRSSQGPFCMEEKRPRAPRQDIFDGSSPFVSGGPHHFSAEEREFGIERFMQPNILLA